MKHILIHLSVIALCGCSSTRYQADTLAAFDQATALDTWHQTLKLDNVTVQVSAKGGPGGNATVRYSDELDVRTVYQYADYLYVSGIRQSTNAILYVKVSGVAMGIWPETLIIPFDLDARSELKAVKIKE